MKGLIFWNPMGKITAEIITTKLYTWTLLWQFITKHIQTTILMFVILTFMTTHFTNTAMTSWLVIINWCETMWLVCQLPPKLGTAWSMAHITALLQSSTDFLLPKQITYFIKNTLPHLDGWTEYLVVPFVKRPTNAPGSSGFFINTFQIFYPDMFQHLVAILRGSWVPDKLIKQLFCGLGVCGLFPDIIRTRSKHRKIAWVAYQALTTLRMATSCQNMSG
jgi:hypothetical protein